MNAGIAGTKRAGAHAHGHREEDPQRQVPVEEAQALGHGLRHDATSAGPQSHESELVSSASSSARGSNASGTRR